MRSAPPTCHCATGFLSALFLLGLAGCAAPGADVTQFWMLGRLADANGKPLAGRLVELTLPAEYGLSGLDASMFAPDAYGHSDRTISVKTDAQGDFECVLGPVTYSKVVFFVPPVGAWPGRPPLPYLRVRLPGTSGLTFLVRFERKRVVATGIDPNSGDQVWQCREPAGAEARPIDLPRAGEGAVALWIGGIVIADGEGVPFGLLPRIPAEAPPLGPGARDALLIHLTRGQGSQSRTLGPLYLPLTALDKLLVEPFCDHSKKAMVRLAAGE